ncbi:hypothetical protein A0H76_1116 [Hepatospora eriocheir]|uniref:Uncharacterized protein n=1 Tax=Hepatospora eriocheir TaxID=1081669 RepID=A0A1X0QHM4_9MICR|nr:hypothetical protein HERIO_713 [Hepatospora eriocheir]ORD99278.1 hypothetical protein A0H76_1116 [Hepatospora eriocheir]
MFYNNEQNINDFSLRNILAKVTNKEIYNKEDKKCICEVVDYKKKFFCMGKCSKKNCVECPKLYINEQEVSVIDPNNTVKYLHKQILISLEFLSDCNTFLRFREYEIYEMNDNILWGREVKQNLEVEISIFACYNNEPGRLIFYYSKNNDLPNISFNKGICPLMFTKHCDQRNSIEYVKEDLVYHTGTVIDSYFIFERYNKELTRKFKVSWFKFILSYLRLDLLSFLLILLLNLFN